ncbi:MAG TPA: rRNA maturation RNase YbeY [Patescibacteria group bacterium]|nr:rRNA maturation RNase YbeY [Patescibacteria group bacterium]
MKVLVNIFDYKFEVSFIKEVLNKAYHYLKNIQPDLKDINELSVVFLAPEKIKEINSIYRNKNKVTDVLSFEDPAEIIICFKVAQKQAKRKEKSLKQEIALLLVHSLLHVFGFDHKEKKQAKKMKQKEKQILSNLNFN